MIGYVISRIWSLLYSLVIVFRALKHLLGFEEAFRPASPQRDLPSVSSGVSCPCRLSSFTSVCAYYSRGLGNLSSKSLERHSSARNAFEELKTFSAVIAFCVVARCGTGSVGHLVLL